LLVATRMKMPNSSPTQLHRAKGQSEPLILLLINGSKCPNWVPAKHQFIIYQLDKHKYQCCVSFYLPRYTHQIYMIYHIT
jgi:hypothetical protein